jgi:hypothetical protein
MEFSFPRGDSRDGKFHLSPHENIYYRSKWKYLLSLEMKIFIIARNENIYYRSKWKYLLSLEMKIFIIALEMKIFIIARNENIYYRSKWKYLLSLEMKIFIIARNENIYYRSKRRRSPCIFQVVASPSVRSFLILSYYSICTYTGTDLSRL